MQTHINAFKKLLTEYADLYGVYLGIDRRGVFDDVVSALMLHTVANASEIPHLYQMMKMGETYSLGLADDVTRHRSTSEGHSAFAGVYNSLTELLRASEPFEDVLTPLYEPLLLGESGQFMTPSSLAIGLRKFIGDKGEQFAEPACGTGSLALAYLAQVYKSDGAPGVVSQSVNLNELDLRLLKVAVFQVLFHSIHHGAPVGELTALRVDVIREYNVPTIPFLHAVSTRRWITKLGQKSTRM